MHVTASYLIINVYTEILITPEQFADIMCEDLRLPTSTFNPLITQAIRQQVEDYYLHASSMVTQNDTVIEQNEDTEQMLQVFQKSDGASTPLPQDIVSSGSPQAELRLVIKVCTDHTLEIVYITRFILAGYNGWQPGPGGSV